ncbi:MAG: hypothetical protein V4710_02830 [Verrucomicrobiota bacterium]
MKSRNAYFITFGLAGALSTILLFNHQQELRQKTAAVFQAVAKSIENKPAPARGADAPEASKPWVLVQPVAADLFSSQIRVPAIREGHNYGWIQLPRGTSVELLRSEGDNLLIRYDDMTVRMPQSAVEEGAVILRKRKVPLTSI